MPDEILFTVQESPEGGLEARARSAAIFTEADTLEGLRERAPDAVECHVEPRERPSVVSLRPAGE